MPNDEIKAMIEERNRKEKSFSIVAMVIVSILIIVSSFIIINMLFFNY